MAVADGPFQSAVIALATGKSAAIDIRGATSVGLNFPAAFDAVAVTFEGSPDGATFAPVSVLQPGEVTVPAISLPSPLASKAISIPWELSPFNYIKLVAAVAADRTVLVSIGL